MKYMICILSLMVFAVTAQAQIDQQADLLSIFSSGDKLIKKAIDSTLCVVRQQYNLKARNVSKNGNYNEYGRNGNAYFGSAYGIGVLTNEGIKTDGKILKPWINDKNYHSEYYRDTLVPNISQAAFKHLGTDKFIEVGTPAANTGQTVITYEYPGAAAGLPIGKTTQDTTGWVALVAEKKGSDGTDPLQFVSTVYKPVVTWIVPQKTAKIKNSTVNDIFIGGIYYTCTVNAGRIIFFASGIVKKNDTGLYIEFFISNPHQHPATEVNNLTPVTPKEDIKQVKVPTDTVATPGNAKTDKATGGNPKTDNKETNKKGQKKPENKGADPKTESKKTLEQVQPQNL